MKVLMIILLLLTHIIAEKKDIVIEELREEFYVATSYKGNEDLAKVVLEKLQNIVNTKYTPLRASYLGSITAKMAVYSFFPWSKISYADDGSKMLNQAIKEEPENIHIRLNRMNTFLNFPNFLKKSHFIQQDARWFISHIKTSKFSKLNYDGKQNIYKVLAMFFAKEKDNDRYYEYYLKLKNSNFIEDVNQFQEQLEK